MEVKWQLQSRPHLSTDCRSLSQISLFDGERNSILGHSYQSCKAGFGIRLLLGYGGQLPIIEQ